METHHVPNGVSPRRSQQSAEAPAALQGGASTQPQQPQGRQRGGQPQRRVGAVNVGNKERLVSTLGGGALVLGGLSRASLGGLITAAVGGSLLYRGLTGHCSVYHRLGLSTFKRSDLSIRAAKSVTINRPIEEVYRFWSNLENLPRFMDHVESVKVDGDRSHWVVKAPAGATVEWDAEVIGRKENEYLAWKAVDSADVPNEGVVRFRPAPGKRGTEIHVMLRYDPPAGRVGVLLAKLLGEDPELQVDDDLHRLKQILEAGEIPTTEGQSSGRRQGG